MDSQHEQLHRNEQNSADFSQSDATKLNYGEGADVIGNPVNPLHDSAGLTSPTSAASAHPPSAGSHPPTSVSHAPSNVSRAAPSPSGNFPTAQMPHALSANRSGVSQSPTAQAASAPPYVQTSSVPGATGKTTPMDSIMQVFNKWGKMAEDMTGNVWNHLRTGPNVADTAFGRIAMGTRAMTEGGLENVYRQTFEVGPEEHLLKTYACYLSTSTGPVAGTLYISSHKLAFCSDRPLALPADNNNNMTNPPAPSATSATSPTATSATSKKTASAHQQQQQQQHCYYKVMVPIPHVESVNPSENTEKKPPEKYVQLKTTDGHEFWFMGFVNYDKGVKNLQETLLSNKASGPNTITGSHDTNAASYDANAASHDANTGSYNTNAASYDANAASHDANAASYGTNAASHDANTASYDTNAASHVVT